MSSFTNAYMVVFELPSVFTKEMFNTIPKQRKVANKLLVTGKIISYTLAADRSTLWVIFKCESESELIFMIDKLPMTIYFEYTYHEIMFHEVLHAEPTFSQN